MASRFIPGYIKDHNPKDKIKKLVLLVASYLAIENIRSDVGLHDEVGAPLDGIQEVVGLSGGAVSVGVRDAAPSQHRHGVGEGEAELDVVTG